MSVAYETVKFVRIGERVGKRQPGQEQVERTGLVGIFPAIVFMAKMGTPLPPGGSVLTHRGGFPG